MTSVRIDSATLDRLRGVTECVQLCDESGCVVGYFRPAGGLQRYPEPPSLDPQQLQQQLAIPNRRQPVSFHVRPFCIVIARELAYQVVQVPLALLSVTTF